MPESIAIETVIEAFLQKARELNLLHERDHLYTRNRLLALLGRDNFTASQVENWDASWLELLDLLVHDAKARAVIPEGVAAADEFVAQVMDLFMPLPSRLEEKFWTRVQEDPKKATDYFYGLARVSDYIKTRRIEKNIGFEAASPYGNLELTINLSKPEKTQEEISKAKAQESQSYPTCALCFENEGYVGRPGYPARSNHRLVHLTLADGTYGFQYSPYVYYPEHCIVIKEEHTPMRINGVTFQNLLAFVEQFPHYFLGSNADLPGVGGSILSHEHYQGGHHQFPMDQAPVKIPVQFPKYPAVKAGLLHWPMAVLRLESQNKEAILHLAQDILAAWQTYDDAERNILAETKGERHNTVTPIARFVEGTYILNIVLRNNRTTPEYPGGIFHPHPRLHHIKQENIGLIEVMGLAILPPRLEAELGTVAAYLGGQAPLEACQAYHRTWAQALKKKYQPQESQVQQVLEAALGERFVEILTDAGVFKPDAYGEAGFCAFVESMGGHCLPSRFVN